MHNQKKKKKAEAPLIINSRGMIEELRTGDNEANQTVAAAEVATTLRRRWSCQNNRVWSLQIEAGTKEVLIGDSWNLYCQR